jgi:hypothetical protein
MKHFPRSIAVALAACIFAVAFGASAQTKPEAYTYDFEPDDLIGETLATTPPLLRVRPQPLRVMLLRPRASFVAEMLKSVEAL